MADIMCTVPDCAAQAVLVLNGHPICRLHCEQFAKQASILEGSLRDVRPEPVEGPRPIGAAQLPAGLDLPDSSDRPS
jgi:hypothetical protein